MGAEKERESHVASPGRRALEMCVRDKATRRKVLVSLQITRAEEGTDGRRKEGAGNGILDASRLYMFRWLRLQIGVGDVPSCFSRTVRCMVR